jgi:hypothetical protein
MATQYSRVLLAVACRASCARGGCVIIVIRSYQSAIKWAAPRHL